MQIKNICNFAEKSKVKAFKFYLTKMFFHKVKLKNITYN